MPSKPTKRLPKRPKAVKKAPTLTQEPSKPLEAPPQPSKPFETLESRWDRLTLGDKLKAKHIAEMRGVTLATLYRKFPHLFP